MRAIAPNRRPSIAIGLIPLVLVAGCGEPGSQGTTVQDSAGIQIVLNPPRDSAPRWTIADTPTVQLGGLQDTANLGAEFTDRQGHLAPLRLGNGTLFVIDDTLVKLFDQSGKLIWAAGRKGSGPGEFGHLFSMCRGRGDTVIVNDDPNARLMAVDAGGKIGPQLTVIPGTFLDGSCLADGSFLLGNVAVGRDPRGWDMIRVTRVRIDGSVVADLGTFPSRLMYSPAPGVMGIRETFFRGLGSSIVVGDGDASEFRIYQTESFKLIRIVRTSDRAAGTISATTFKQESEGGSNKMSRTVENVRQAMFEDLRVGEDNAVWMRDTIVRSGKDRKGLPLPAGWVKFDSTGKMALRLELPNRSDRAMFKVVQFGEREVICWWMDGDGAQRLGTFPLVPKTPRP